MDSPTLPRRDLGIALSGGGHRATLFTLGALLYVVDVGANERVSSVASVSGGSITNGYVAQECDFGTVKVPEFDGLARRLVGVIVRRGLVSMFRGVGLLFIAILLVLISATALAGVSGYPWVSAGLALASVCFFQSRGWIVERRLQGTLFRDAQGKPTLLGGLKSRATVHTICATELNAPAPMYFVAWGRGSVRSPRYGWGYGTAMSLASAVRSSASLPGAFPPRLLSSRGLDFSPDPGGSKKVPPLLFLSDGGVWNNLATQWFEGDRIADSGGFRLRTPQREAAPVEIDPLSLSLVVVDGSGKESSVTGIRFALPGVGEVAALLRVLNVLYVNTVWPRVRSFDQNTLNYWRWGQHPRWDLDYDRPIAVASLARPSDWWTGGRIMGAFPETDEEVSARKQSWASFYQAIPDHLCDAYPGFPTKDSLPDYCAGEGTHLACIKEEVAIALLMRGYLSTMAAMHVTYGTGLVDFKEERFLRLLPSTSGS